MRIILLATFVLVPWVASAQSKLLSPEEFLGYPLGERFTAHQRAVDYYTYVANELPNVELFSYGETYEHRPLLYVVVTSPENFKNLETIRQDNLKRAGVVEGTTSLDKKVIVWMSYNVHGNEASGMEAALQTLYELSDPQNQKTQTWLKNTVVILDPCINPDGRDRFANFYRQYANTIPNASEDAFEQNEVWPGGRPNHYLFDLNRDWAWATQAETQQRIKVYNQWYPHVHVDFHEQSHNSPYYFAPAAEPFHEVITPWQREFQTMIGKNHASYFDQHGWLYFTREVFDLFYPSYGDTYPTYSGAIGMTYEQGGLGSGVTITTREGDPLTLKDRYTHHHTAGLSTVEISAQHYSKVVDEFQKYFNDNKNNPTGTYKSYVIKGSNNPDKLKRLTQWLNQHNIQYGYAGSAKVAKGFDYQTQTNTTVNIGADDIVLNIYQPKSRFITSVFEPQSKLPDSLTYDVTAWNLMYAYNLQAYAVTERINIGKAYQTQTVDATLTATKPYAYVVAYKTLEDATFLGALLQEGITVRSAQFAFTTQGKSFDPGTLIITRRNNEKISSFDDLVQSIAAKHGRKLFAATTGFVDKGKDFGSSDVNYLQAPKVAMLFGNQTSSLSAGEVWHFFEQNLKYPITQIATDDIGRTKLDGYQVLIVPEGRYKLFTEEMLQSISSWVSDGGRLILVGNAVTSFAEKKGFSLKKYENEEEKKAAEEKEEKSKNKLLRYEHLERDQVSDYISGAIYKVKLDNSHPLAFGLSNTYYSLKTNELKYSFLNDGWNVGVIAGKAKPIQGFAGKRANAKLDNSLVFGVQQKGKGNVVYMVDNPLFRSFWEDGKMVFANAVFMVGQ